MKRNFWAGNIPNLDVEILQTFQVPDPTTAAVNPPNIQHDVDEDLPKQNCDSSNDDIDLVKHEVKLEPSKNINFAEAREA